MMNQDINQVTPTKSPMMGSIDWPLLTFFALAYLIAWGMIPVFAYIADQAGLPDWIALVERAEMFDFTDVALTTPPWLIYFLTRIQDFAFSLAGVLLIVALHGRAGLRVLGQRLITWRVGRRWWLLAFAPFGLYGLATAAAGALNSLTLSTETISTILFSAEAGFFVYLFLRGAMGEELGLRGFALPRLQETMSPFRASVVIGIAWSLWHLPVLMGRGIVSIMLFLVLAFALSFLFTWLFNGSGGSLLPVLIFHAIQNAEEVFETLFPVLKGTDWELVSSIGLLLLALVGMWRLWNQPIPTSS